MAAPAGGGFSVTGFIKKQAGKVRDTFLEGKKQIDNFLEDPEEERGFNWESGDYVDLCRSCQIKFGPTLWKHHCRQCGGVICESCSTVVQDDSKHGRQAQQRYCVGCRRGETPGDALMALMELALAGKRKKLSLVQKTQKKIVTNLSDIGEPVKLLVHSIDDIVQGDPNGVIAHAFPPPSVPIALSRGSRYGEDGFALLITHEISMFYIISF